MTAIVAALVTRCLRGPREAGTRARMRRAVLGPVLITPTDTFKGTVESIRISSVARSANEQQAVWQRITSLMGNS